MNFRHKRKEIHSHRHIHTGTHIHILLEDMKAAGRVLYTGNKTSANYFCKLGNVGQKPITEIYAPAENRPCWSLNYKQDNPPDVNICLLFQEILDHAKMQTWIIDIQSRFPQIHTEYTFSTKQFASGGWWTMNTCTSKHIDNWCCCSTGQLALSLPCIFTAHIKYTKTKCPFQRQQGDDAVQPSPPKSQTKVHPCCHGQNMPFCHKQTDAVVMYSAALQLQSKHKGHLLILDWGTD